MEDYYSNSENYAIWEQYIFPKSEDSRREKICRPNMERIVQECTSRGMVKPTIVEIGPGFGTFSALTKFSGFFGSVSVVERTPSMAKACRDKGLQVIESSLETLSDDYLAYADVVVCFEVIEHVFEPLEFLAGINRMLKPGGVLMFTCPNGAGFDTAMLKTASPAVDTEHVNLFNPQSIQHLLKRSGFAVDCVETPGRLDVELVRRALLANQIELDLNSFWRRVLVDDFSTLGAVFQRFLVEHKLSGNMRVIATKSTVSD
jgi:2-polyprenyl-3-methyl-5-hydroxy-6-metoxy-1,4-benzoquinol methylase